MADFTIYNISSPFDAAKVGGYEFDTGYTHSSAIDSKLIINNISDTTENPIEISVQSQAQFKYTIPTNTLTNGVVYTAYATYTVNNIEYKSNIIVFRCLATPTFVFSNIDSTIPIDTSSYYVLLNYLQTDNEPLHSYIISLFNINEELLYTTNAIYNTTNALGCILTNLQNDKTYKIQAKGETLHGVICDTGKITFSVAGIVAHKYFSPTIKNNYTDGTIEIRTNYEPIQGMYFPSDSQATYIDNNQAVDLSSNGCMVQYTKDLGLEGQYQWRIQCKDINPNSLIAMLQNDKYITELYYYIKTVNNVETKYLVLNVDNHLIPTTYYKEIPNNIITTNYFTIIIKYQNGFYSIDYTQS